MNDNDIVSKFKATVHILFVFGRIIVLIIHIQPNSEDPLFGTALVVMLVCVPVYLFLCLSVCLCLLFAC